MPESPALKALKTHAKHLLARARSGDSSVIAGLRQYLPKLTGHSDNDFALNVKLADVQHALARERGLKSWDELKRALERLDPLPVKAERFLKAVRDSDLKRAARLLAATPGISRYNAQAAAAACDAEALEQLLQADATLATGVAQPDGREPIVYASGTPLAQQSDAMAQASARCVSLLLEHGASANASIALGDEEGQMPVLYFASSTNNVGAVRLLLQHGANPNDGESVHHSAERNYRDVLELLLEAGADISSRHPHWDNTPLYFLSGYKPVHPLCAPSELGMMWLLEHGANPNVASYVNEEHKTLPSSGEQPLHRVSEFGKGVSIARALVEHGAEVDAPRADGKTAYALAVRTGNTAVSEYLAGVGANTNALTIVDQLTGACAVGNADAAHAIVAAHPDIVSTLNTNDRRALVLAAEEGRANSVRLMVSLGWSLSDEGAWGGTPLHHAAWLGNVAMTQLLLELGAPVNVRDSQYGSSPLAWAAHGSTYGRPGHDDDYCAVIDLLLNAGSTREASYNKWNEAPESMSSKAVAKLLKQRGFPV